MRAHVIAEECGNNYYSEIFIYDGDYHEEVEYETGWPDGTVEECLGVIEELEIPYDSAPMLFGINDSIIENMFDDLDTFLETVPEWLQSLEVLANMSNTGALYMFGKIKDAVSVVLSSEGVPPELIKVDITGWYPEYPDHKDPATREKQGE